MQPSRRLVLKTGLALPAALILPGARAAATPGCGDETPAQTAGPFYTPDSPAKRDFRADDPAGAPVDLRAVVLDTECRPVEGALVDLWHSDSRGRYDNDGWRLRGHQRAAADGSVQFATVLPGNYGGRTRHYHVRIFAPQGGRLLTTQLYFPGEPGNAGDWLFKPRLLLDVAQGGRAGTALAAAFTFVVGA